MSASAPPPKRACPDPSLADATLHVLPGASSAASAARTTLALVTTREGFDALETSWNELFTRAGRDTQLFQTFNWLWHWANHFLPAPSTSGPELAIVTAHIDGRLVMVWPLVSERSGPLKRLTWMGEPVSQYGDVLLDDLPDGLALLREAWDFVTHHTGASLVQLRKVREDSAIAPLLAEIGATIVSELKAPFLDLKSAPSFDEYERRYSSSARRNRKRQRRRLDERGRVALHWHTEGAEAEALTAEAFKFKQIWLRRRALVSPAFADPRTAHFFADVTRAETRPAGCHVLALTCDGAPVALEIGLRCKGRSAIHIIAHDLDYEKTAAGALLMEDSIRNASDNGIAVFDMLAPGDGYKLEWADDAVVVRDWAAPISLFGRVYSVLHIGLRTVMKRSLDVLPMGVRRKVTDVLTKLIKPKA